MHQEIGKIALGRNDLFRGLPPDPVSSKQNKLGDGPPHQQRGAAGGGGGALRAEAAAEPTTRWLHGQATAESTGGGLWCVVATSPSTRSVTAVSPVGTSTPTGCHHSHPCHRRSNGREQLITAPRAAASPDGSSLPRSRVPPLQQREAARLGPACRCVTTRC
jgi:hypothetical protein